jgi:fumarate hydratase class II
MGNDVTVSIAGSNGHFELNVFKPVIAATTIGVLLATLVFLLQTIARWVFRPIYQW